MPCRTRTLIILSASVLLLGAALSAQAAGFANARLIPVWDDIFAGTRSESMGQADLAVSRGPMAIFDNPAPLPEGRGAQLGYGNLDFISTIQLHQYAVSAESDHLRLGFARMDFTSDDVPVQTSYNPTGAAETTRLDDRVRVISGSMDVAGLLAPGTAWRWIVGVSHREYRLATPDETTHLRGLDFGSSVRYGQQRGNLHLTGSAAGVLRNITDDRYVPEDTRLGLGLTIEVDGRQMRRAMALTLVYLFQDLHSEKEYFGVRRYGAELTLLQALSVRLGHDNRIFGGTNQLGVGLTLPRSWTRPLVMSADWGAVNSGTLREIGVTGRDSFDMFTVTVRYELPPRRMP